MNRSTFVGIAFVACCVAAGLACAQGTLRVSVRFDDSAAAQQLQVPEGGHATIYTGQSPPLREQRYIQTPAGVIPQQVTAVQDSRRGFEIVPRLAGSRVQVDIAGATGTTSASGPLGEWFALGAVATEAGSRRVWIKVEALP